MCWLNQAEWKALDATDPRPGREKGRRGDWGKHMARRKGGRQKENRGVPEWKREKWGSQMERWKERKPDENREKERSGGEQEEGGEKIMRHERQECLFIQTICRNPHTAQQASSPRFISPVFPDVVRSRNRSESVVFFFFFSSSKPRAIILTRDGKIHETRPNNPRLRGSDRHLGVLQAITSTAAAQGIWPG